ncbi:DUF6344 domain-containing protein [Streptomyces sp. NBC_00247]|uniref:DUF6344 domain-containing protein n=1 Tax=Streptomyces sp. NBC_00247 TaxID=2975689 RepID=UPI002E2E5782|nr:DUF6344 domain-containing protein [Streptomyces sp. NBC_00247]
MSAFKVKNLWTAFITAFFALLASLGLAASNASASNASATEQQPTHTTTQEHTGATAATATTPSVRWTLPRDRALPPTMKQRIRAEAHGSSPATRHLPADTASTPGTEAARTNYEATEGESPLPPP